MTSSRPVKFFFTSISPVIPIAIIAITSRTAIHGSIAAIWLVPMRYNRSPAPAAAGIFTIRGTDLSLKSNIVFNTPLGRYKINAQSYRGRPAAALHIPHTI